MNPATIFTAFKNQWIDQWIDYDGVDGYQCVDLIKQYVHQCYGLSPGSWGNAINYWTNTAPALLAQFSKVAGSAAQEGDIVVFNGLPGNSAGHIAIATGNINASQVEVLEEDGHTGTGTKVDGNQVRTRYIDRSRAAGLLRPHSTAPAPAPSHNETIKAGTWNVRTAPSVSASVEGIAKGGQVYSTSVIADGWRQITFNGKTGFVGPLGWAN